MKYSLNFLFDYVFPNFVIPNATDIDFGIINYIYTKYNSKIKGNALFQSSHDPDSIMLYHTLFNNSLGLSGTTSLTGFFYESATYEEIADIKVNSVYFGTSNNNKKFIYPIKISADITNFTACNEPNVGYKNKGEFFWKNISQATLDYIKSNRAKILLDYTMEPFVEKRIYEYLNYAISQSGIDKNSIILCVNSFNARELYESWFKEEERMLQVRNLPFCLDYTSFHYRKAIEYGKTQCMKIDDFLNTRTIIRKNHFLMVIRSNREHRVALLVKMLSNNLLEYGDWSFFSEQSRYDIASLGYLKNKFKLKDMNIGKVKQLYLTAPHNLQSEQGITANDINAWTDEKFTMYENAYFNICFETTFDGECAHHKSLTEKIFKPIVNFQPFIFVAYPGALNLLRELGFKTFHPFIDESYDTITDPAQKILQIYNEVKRLCSMSIEEMHEWYWGMEDILIHNHNKLINYNNEKILAEEVISELSEFLKTADENF